MEPLHVAVAAFSFFAPHNSQEVENEPAQYVSTTERVIRVGESAFRAIARASGLISLASFVAIEAIVYVKEENSACPFLGSTLALGITSIATGAFGLLSLGVASLFNVVGESRANERDFVAEQQRVKKALQLRDDLESIKKDNDPNAIELVVMGAREVSAEHNLGNVQIPKNILASNSIKVNLRVPSRLEQAVNMGENLLYGVAKVAGGAAALGLTALQINQKRMASCGWEHILDPTSLTCFGLGIFGSISYGLSFFLGAAGKCLQSGRISEALQAEKNV